MKLNQPPDPLIEQALDKFAAEQGLTRTPRGPQPDSAKLADPSSVSALNAPPNEANDTKRT